MERETRKKAELIIWETAKNHNNDGSIPIEERRQKFVEDAAISLASKLDLYSSEAEHFARQWAGLVVSPSMGKRIQTKDKYNGVQVFQNIWKRENPSMAVTGPEYSKDYKDFREAFI